MLNLIDKVCSNFVISEIKGITKSFVSKEGSKETYAVTTEG